MIISANNLAGSANGIADSLSHFVICIQIGKTSKALCPVTALLNYLSWLHPSN